MSGKCSTENHRRQTETAFDFSNARWKRCFGELKRLILDISEQMLLQELKKRTQLGIINRKA